MVHLKFFKIILFLELNKGKTKKNYLLGFIWDIAASKSKLTTGGSSNSCSQPTGGEAGGEIKNNLSLCGASKCFRVFFNLIGFFLSF